MSLECCIHYFKPTSAHKLVAVTQFFLRTEQHFQHIWWRCRGNTWTQLLFSIMKKPKVWARCSSQLCSSPLLYKNLHFKIIVKTMMSSRKNSDICKELSKWFIWSNISSALLQSVSTNSFFYHTAVETFLKGSKTYIQVYIYRSTIKSQRTKCPYCLDFREQ